jgi:hypothetical protein
MLTIQDLKKAFDMFFDAPALRTALVACGSIVTDHTSRLDCYKL